ncbi:MAG: hypothetical protein L6Q66_12045 [Bacteroidia bacterium]|nr:hypothetical protein [Bacteroidia bacterium]
MIKFIENLIEFISMVKIALSPILLFTIAGIIAYIYIDGMLGIIAFSLLSVLGLALGIWWAISIHKKHGATEFNAKISATPELDEKDKK